MILGVVVVILDAFAPSWLAGFFSIDVAQDFEDVYLGQFNDNPPRTVQSSFSVFILLSSYGFFLEAFIISSCLGLIVLVDLDNDFVFSYLRFFQFLVVLSARSVRSVMFSSIMFRSSRSFLGLLICVTTMNMTYVPCASVRVVRITIMVHLRDSNLGLSRSELRHCVHYNSASPKAE